VVQRAALAQRHADQPALGGLGRLADRLGHLARLAVAEADAALLVADHHQRGEAEATAALHHLGDAVDVTSRSTNSPSRSSRSRSLISI
jgi:hypothetical protein